MPVSEKISFSDMEGAGELVSPHDRHPGRLGQVCYLYKSVILIFTNPWDLSLPSIQIRHSYLTYPLVPEKTGLVPNK